ncbi:MAG: glycerol-3-phosphate 1-O-acyltransferase [Myxococcota bacterium]|nr:glycerol-3-phosphate 1-O-acyltransferase [Myxococcota bacterium]
MGAGGSTTALKTDSVSGSGSPAPDTNEEARWPGEGRTGRMVFLLDVATAFEDKLLRRWIAENDPGTAGDGEPLTILGIPSSRRSRGRVDPRLESTLAAGDDLVLAPLRVAWFPAVRDGRRRARLSDLLTLGDPRDPGRLRARWVHATHSDRWRIVVGEPATASELKARWHSPDQAAAGATQGLAEFVARQAALALERGERRLRGARYKVPRFVHEEVLSRPSLRGELARLAGELGKDEGQVNREASGYLKEIAATHSPFVIDLVVQLWRRLTRRGYDELIRFDPAAMDRLRKLSERYPVVFLPSHKSNLDHPALQILLHEHGLPPNHTAGGINMNFFPVGPLVRRSGTFFIRRSFKDLPIYKVVLGHYIDYLIEKRFPLEWYIEGGRSRSGKLLPPRFGLLAYVVDAYLRGRSEDVFLIPVSIGYDQISDVGDYASEQRGGTKQKEGFAWFLRLVRRLGRSYGRISVDFGEPLSLAATLGSPTPGAEPHPDEQDLALQKLAFECCVRINAATPITPISLVCLALLGRGERSLSAKETVVALANLVDYVENRGLATTEPLNLRTAEGVEETLQALNRSGLLTRFKGGPETVYRIADDQHLVAAYYRNAVIHYFVDGAIAELALVRAAELVEGDRTQVFWDEAMLLRDLLKFEFFFEEKDAFREDVRREMALHEIRGERWEDELEKGPEAILAFLQEVRPLSAHRILRPFLEAYRVVADALCLSDPQAAIEEPEFLERCLSLGTQYALQQHVKRRESISKVLFATALKLAANRGLLEPGTEDLAGRREAFAEEIRGAIRGVDAIEVLVRARHAGLFDRIPRHDE